MGRATVGMRWAWGLLAAIACTGAATAARAELPVIENAGYALCVSEANDALWVGRLAKGFGRSRAEIESDPSLPPFMRSLVADFFREEAEGRGNDYVLFGLRRFRACLATQKVRFEETDPKVYACLTRMDIPYFFQLLKQSGDTLEAATPKVQKALAGWHYPEQLVPRMAAAAWAMERIQDVHNMQAFLFNACVLPVDQVTTFYGIPATAKDRAGAGSPEGGEGMSPVAPPESGRP